MTVNVYFGTFRLSLLDTIPLLNADAWVPARFMVHVLGMIISLYFMWDLRRPKTKWSLWARSGSFSPSISDCTTAQRCHEGTLDLSAIHLNAGVAYRPQCPMKGRICYVPVNDRSRRSKRASVSDKISLYIRISAPVESARDWFTSNFVETKMYI